MGACPSRDRRIRFPFDLRLACLAITIIL